MKPILFSDPMVRALNAGTKTQTRRVMNPQPISVEDSKTSWEMPHSKLPGGQSMSGCPLESAPAGARPARWFQFDLQTSGLIMWRHSRVYADKNRWHCSAARAKKFGKHDQKWSEDEVVRYLAPYRVGDVLWVREAWWQDTRDRHCVIYAASPEWGIYEHDRIPVRSTCPDGYLPNTEECQRNLEQSEFWYRKPSIHFPRWAARIFLRVTEVRVQRVQEISEADATAEGVDWNPEAPAALTHRTSFARLWDKLNTKRGYGWGSNPWVWAYTLAKVDGQRATEAG